jgi:hypothetical protein
MERLDVAIFGYMGLRMTQDALDNFFIRAQLIQIRRNATPEPLPAIPFQPDRFNHWTDDSLSQFVEVHRLTVARVKYHAGFGIAHVCFASR